MKPLRYMLSFILLSLSTVAFAQSDAQKSYDKLKTLAGSWEGHVTITPPQAEMADGTLMQVSLRVTSRGNALVHEMRDAGKSDDPSHYDTHITMPYLACYITRL